MKAEIIIDPKIKAIAMKPFLKKLETINQPLQSKKPSKKGFKSLMAQATRKQKEAVVVSENKKK